MLFYFVRYLFILFYPFITLSASVYPCDISEQVRKVLPSVVKVKVQRNENIDEENELISLDGGGSGFVFDSSNHVITNAHVIKDAKKILIIDNNHVEYPATLLGKDDKTDIAILDVPSFSAPQLIYSKLSEHSIGESVFVIGSPFSLGHSVSLGIISMTGRFLSNYPYVSFIQTDAAINPGNSGGAMFDLQGNVIGMASTYYSKQGGYTNIGFAIPSEDLLRIGEQLIRKNIIQRGNLGAELMYSEKISRKMGYSNAIYIARVFPKSPADISGLKTGDLIIKNNYQSFSDGGEFFRFLERSRPGDDVNLTIVRNKTSLDCTVRLSNELETKMPITNAGSGDNAEKMGLILSEDNEVIKILTAFAGAMNIGLDSNDLIVDINNIKINSIKDFNSQLSKIKDNELVLMTIQRNGEKIIVPFGSKTGLKANSSKN